MICRIAEKKDFPFLAEMRWNFRQEGGEEVAVDGKAEFLEKCIDFLAAQTHLYTYWVAEIDGEIVSHIFVNEVKLVPRPCRVSDSFAYLTNVYTKPDFRQKGIGSELLKAVIEWSNTKDFEILLVYPSENSVNFYKRFNFQSDDEIMKLVLRDY